MVQRYNPERDIWELVTSMGVCRQIACLVADEHYLYAIGGLQASSGQYLETAEKYDPNTAAWTSIASMHEPRAGATATLHEERIYIFGGESDVRMALKTCEIYVILRDEWLVITSMRVPRYFAGSAVVGQRIYVFGGIGGENVPHDQKRTVEMFESGTNEWSAELEMPWEERFFRCCTIRLRRDLLCSL